MGKIEKINWQLETLKILEKCGVIISNTHVVYSSGRHGSKYLNKDFLYAYPRLFTAVANMLAACCSLSNPQVIVGASIGGALLANRIGMIFDENFYVGVLSAFAEETEEGGEIIRVFRREYDKLISFKRVLVVEDIVTSGLTLRRVVAAVRKIGGEVVGIGIIWNRGGINFEDLCVEHIRSLIDLILDSYDENDCPFCKANIPINTSIGKGREFLARKNKPQS